MLTENKPCSNRHDNSSEADFEFHCSVPSTSVKKCRYSKTVTRTVHHANHSSISLNESSPRFPPEPPVRLQHYTSSDALTLQDLSGFIYFIPSILFIHSPVIAVKHSAHCYQFLDKIHFFLQPPSCLKPSSVAY